VTPTSGSDFSRWPPFKWQLLHDIRPGASRGATDGVLVNNLNPRRISSESGDLSSDGSTSGFFGNSHAVTIVVLAAMRGPVIFGPAAVGGSGAREHAAPVKSARVARTAIGVDLMMERA